LTLHLWVLTLHLQLPLEEGLLLLVELGLLVGSELLSSIEALLLIFEHLSVHILILDHRIRLFALILAHDGIFVDIEGVNETTENLPARLIEVV
jgi:hypothetical protein